MKQNKISKTEIDWKISKKLNPELKKLAIALKKKNMLEVADLILLPKRRAIKINLEEINKHVKDGENIIIPGKVLGLGNVQKKFNIAALNFSESAREKLEKAGCKIISMLEIKNPKIIK